MTQHHDYREIPGFEGRYLVAESGEVMRNYGKFAGRIMRPSTSRQGYKLIQLTHPTKGRKSFKIHRLVAEVFIKKSDMQVNHKDGNTSNNHFSNLEYVSVRENKLHSMMNRQKLTGAFRHTKGNCWFSRIRINNKYKYLGTYPTEEEAHKAYLMELEKSKEKCRYVRTK